MDEKHAEQAGTPTEPSPPAHVIGQVAEMLASHRILAGRYEIRSRIGAGGMGFVYRAHDRALDEDVALKVLFPERLGAQSTLRRIRREVKTARKVTHPNVCRVFDIGEDGDIWFLTMELVEGRTLRSLLRDGRIPTEQALTILEQVAAGLAAAHAQGVVHLDLKPENIMIRPNGEVVVVDFGVARSILTSGNTTGNIAGTLAYISPEHLQGGPLDARSDIFSLGIVALELLTGRLPMSRTPIPTVDSSGLRHTESALETSELPPEARSTIKWILARALAERPANRFTSASEFLAALVPARRGALQPNVNLSGPEAHASTRHFNRFAPAPHTRRSRHWTTAGATLALLGLATIPFAWNMLHSPTSTVSKQQPINIPTITVLEFTNLSNDTLLDEVARGATEAVRAGLRTIPEVHVSDGLNVGGEADRPSANAGVWIVTGSAHRVGERIRLTAQIRSGDGGAAGEPIDIDRDPSQTAAMFSELRQRSLDEARLLWRSHDKRRWAERGTSNTEARSNMLQYLSIIEAGTALSNLDAAMPLLDRALALDPDYVPALTERAYARLLSVHQKRSAYGQLNQARNDTARALVIAPEDPHVLVMNCRITQAAAFMKESPTDVDMHEAKSACEAAMQSAPSSAHVPFTLARIYDAQCKDDQAMTMLEAALDLDRSLAGRIFAHMATIAIYNDQLTIADRASEKLLRFQEEERRLGTKSISRRAGIEKAEWGHILRAAALIRMGRLEETESELQHELESPSRFGNPWGELAALRGLTRVAAIRGTAMPPIQRRRLGALEEVSLERLKVDAWFAKGIVEAYVLVDAAAAINWLERLPPPLSFRDAFFRARTYYLGGYDEAARRSLITHEAREEWEKSCFDWIQAKLNFSSARSQ